MVYHVILPFIAMIILDFIWLTLQKPMYRRMVFKVQNSDLQIYMPSAFVAYFLMFISLAYIIYPLVKNLEFKSKKDMIIASIRYGGIVGLCIYGIYNATNMAIFTNYSINAALLDTLWGVCIYTLTTFIILYIK
jgi:uncharacterized membrane protein